MSKRILSVILAVLLVPFMLSAGGSKETKGTQTAAPAAAKPIVIKVAETQPLTSAMTTHITKYGEMLKERSKGRIVIEIYPGAMLGASPAVAQQLQMGAVDQFRSDPALLFDMGVKSMQVLGLPYLFNSIEHAQKVAYGPIGQKFLDDIDNSNANMVGIGYMIEAPRNFFLRNKRVSKMSDAKGLKIRVPESKIFLESMAAFGISGTPISMGEVYSALQTGIVDGAENSLDTFNVNKFHEVCKYITLSGHMYGVFPIIFSKVNWKKLSADDQALVKKTWQDAAKMYDAYAAQKYAETVATIKKNGVEIVEMENPKEWQDAVAPLQAKYAQGYESLVKDIINFK
jgi:tripartite ATP-independent transporter DctP family solute receptor